MLNGVYDLVNLSARLHLQLRKLLPLKGSKYQALVRKYLNFDDEMTRIGNLWPETEPWMDKYK